MRLAASSENVKLKRSKLANAIGLNSKYNARTKARDIAAETKDGSGKVALAWGMKIKSYDMTEAVACIQYGLRKDTCHYYNKKKS